MLLLLYKFKQVPLARMYMPSQGKDVAKQTEEPLALPYAYSSKYSWDMLVFLIIAILRRNGIYGKAAYRPENRPSWWPRDVHFSCPNSNTQVIIVAVALDVWEKRFKQNILVFSCEKIKIFTKTILFTKDQVPDEIIDAFMYSLLRYTRSKYQYIPCSVMSLMLNRKHQGKVADVEIAAESIIGLFNNGRRHWILVIISASARRMTILNPLGEVDESLTGLLSTWKSFLANSNVNLKMTLGPDWEVVTLPHSKQPDSTSCGIFCLKFVEKLLKEEELLLPSQPNDILQYRLDILESIAKNQDITIKELCRLCGCKMPPGKENRVQWSELWYKLLVAT